MADRLIPVSPGELSPAEQGFDLRGMLGFIWRQWKFTIAIALITVLAGMVYLLHVTPLYTATAQVLLDRQREKAPGGDAILGDVMIDTAMIESQVSIIKSTVLLRRVVAKESLGLLHRAPVPAPPSAPVDTPSPSDRLFGFFRAVGDTLRGDETKEADAAENKFPPVTVAGEAVPPAELRAIAALKTALRVTRVAPQGHVLAISVTSPDPARAAQLANAVADAYLVDKLDTRFEAAKRASAWLSDRLAGLRKQLRESEEAVEQFRAQHGLVLSGRGGTLTQQQLSDLNAKLIDAKADLAQKKARVDLLNSLQAKGGGLQNMPDIANGGALPALRQQAADLSAQEADLLARYGAAHPLVVNLRARLGDVERSIGAETARLAASIRNEYELAQARVRSLQNSLQEATGQTNLDDATAIRLRELERTAAVNKTLFEDFLKQAKITQEQSTFEPQDVRVITPALPPAKPSYPRQAQFLTVALFVGLLLGVTGALAKEKLNTGFTTPKQVEDVLGLPLLTSVCNLASRDLKLGDDTAPIHRLPILRPLSRYGEAIRSLRSGIQMTDVDHPPKVIQLTSAVPGEGKTTIALSLAASAAAAKLRVLVIDADLRHPSVSRICGLDKGAGLVDLLLGEVAAEAAIGFYGAGGYWVLPAGNRTQSPTDLLGSERMKSLIATLRTAYDLVFVDTPPAGPVADPVVLSYLCDKIVLVVRWAVTARELIKPCVELLAGHRKIAGVAFNRVNIHQAQKYGRYAYPYYYGSRYYKNYYTS
jgi:capsular exopolysaccharide synthesis family protein